MPSQVIEDTSTDKERIQEAVTQTDTNFILWLCAFSSVDMTLVTYENNKEIKQSGDSNTFMAHWHYEYVYLVVLQAAMTTVGGAPFRVAPMRMGSECVKRNATTKS